MHVSSLGFRTDLALLTASGSVVEDRGTHLVVRYAGQPDLLLGQLPPPRRAARARRRARGGGRVPHRVPRGRPRQHRHRHRRPDPEARAAFEAAGLRSTWPPCSPRPSCSRRARSRPRCARCSRRRRLGGARPPEPALYPQTDEEAFMRVRPREERAGASARRRRPRHPVRRLRRRRGRQHRRRSSSPRRASRASRASRRTPTTGARGWPPRPSTRPGQHALEHLGVRTLVIVADDRRRGHRDLPPPRLRRRRAPADAGAPAGGDWASLDR